MKKALSLLTVTLLVVTSLISGVFAVYSTTIEDANEGATTAKHFFVGANTTDSIASDAEIAPGETVQSTFTITNKDDAVSEVDIDVTMTVELTSEIAPLEISINGLDVAGNGEGTYTFTMPAGTVFNEEYTVELSWPVGDTSGSDNAFIDKTASYSIDVTGTQSID